jgi:hypothetical protein
MPFPPYQNVVWTKRTPGIHDLPTEGHGGARYSANNSFTIPLPHVIKEQGKIGIMKTYWCCKKNSVTDWILNGIDFNPALVRCIKEEWDEWRDGLCIHRSTAGK